MSSDGYDNNAIRLTGVSKSYYTYDRPQDRLKQFIFKPLRRIFGLKENTCHLSLIQI